MPASKRRTSGGPTAASKSKSKSQSTLAFHGKTNKVTKPGSGLPSGKVKKEPAVLDSISQTDLTEEADLELEEPTTAETSIIEQTEAEAKVSLTPEEEEASQVKEAQIKKYWREKEALRKVPRVHQEGLSLHEKVCREFDMNGRYGPCVGIARIKRWKRAQNLGLKPPIEVLAILLQGENSADAQRAYVDELMGAKVAEA